jgi:hypothetical protein
MTALAADLDRGRAPRWMVAALMGSLALNLVVIGATLSFLWRQHFDPADVRLSGFVPRHELGYAVTLPPERVKELERLTEQEWRNVRPLRRALLEARDEVVKALTAEPFDRQRYLDAQAKLHAADQKSREAALQLRSAIGLHLTPAERQGYLRWRQQQRPFHNPLDEPAKQPDGAQP